MKLNEAAGILESYYKGLDESAAVAAKIKELTDEILAVLKIALDPKIGRGRPMPREVYEGVFRCTMRVMEHRKTPIHNEHRVSFSNDREGMELALAVVNENDKDHAMAVEMVTKPKDNIETKPKEVVQVAQVVRPVDPLIDPKLPKGAEDLTDTLYKEA